MIRTCVWQLLLPTCIAIIFLSVYRFSFCNENNFLWCESFGNLNIKDSRSENYHYFYSSVFCRGSNQTDRLCRFQNLCYEPKTESFVFFQGPKSIRTGLPPDRFSPALTDFSSVSDHNTQYFNYVELPDFSLQNFNVSFIRGHGLVFKRFNPDNLMHVFHDDLLPIFVTLNELSLISTDSTHLVIADNRPPSAYSSLYETFLQSKPVYIHSLSDTSLHCFESTYIGLNKLSTWYQYGFKEPQGPLKKLHNDAIIPNFREYFIKRFSLKPQSKREYASLLVRKHNRKILNENEIIRVIANHTGLETHAVSLDTSSVLEVIQEILVSSLVVAMHGSLLILSLFLEPNSVVIELFPFGVNPNISTPYKTLCELPGLKLLYGSWQNGIEMNSFPHPEYPPERGGFQQLPLTEQKEIQSSVVSPFICCDNPAWLYRIYQDTFVDTQSFVILLQDMLEMQKNALVNQQLNRSLVDKDHSKSTVHHKSLDCSEEFRIHPSEVQNASCSGNSSALILEWEQPWNMQFVKTAVVEYEVWLQGVGEEDVHAFLMKTKKFVFPLKSSRKSYYAWIRCHADGLAGPFSSNPVICTL